MFELSSSRLFVVQGCSTLSRDQQPQVPKDDKGGSSATVQPGAYRRRPLGTARV